MRGESQSFKNKFSFSSLIFASALIGDTKVKTNINKLSISMQPPDESHLFFSNMPGVYPGSLKEKVKSNLLLAFSLAFASISAGGIFWLVTTVQ